MVSTTYKRTASFSTQAFPDNKNVFYPRVSLSSIWNGHHQSLFVLLQRRMRVRRKPNVQIYKCGSFTQGRSHQMCPLRLVVIPRPWKGSTQQICASQCQILVTRQSARVEVIPSPLWPTLECQQEPSTVATCQWSTSIVNYCLSIEIPCQIRQAACPPTNQYANCQGRERRKGRVTDGAVGGVPPHFAQRYFRVGHHATQLVSSLQRQEFPPCSSDERQCGPSRDCNPLVQPPACVISACMDVQMNPRRHHRREVSPEKVLDQA